MNVREWLFRKQPHKQKFSTVKPTITPLCDLVFIMHP